jgi:tRNA G18 (ribose-2'-O)-methylase SpoU
MAFEHQRHKPPVELARPRELLLVCAPLRSNVNLSQIVRLAGCCGLPRVICCGQGRVEAKIARDGADTVQIEAHRTLPPVLPELREQGYRLVGLEQTTGAVRLPEYCFPRRTALVVGNERLGLEPEVLALLDDVVEIPMFGRPYALNVAMATAMALYEYCRQYPAG